MDTLEPIPTLMATFVDLALSGDNAVVIGMAAAALPAPQRRQAIVWGIAIAVVIRIALALGATQLLEVPGLKLAGGLLLAWVCWRLWRDLMPDSAQQKMNDAVTQTRNANDIASDAQDVPARLTRAMTSIIVADISMSLDNVIAIAGIAKGNTSVLIFGLGLSIALMATAATIIASLLERYRWIAYAGLAIIIWVAGDLIINGAQELMFAARVAV